MQQAIPYGGGRRAQFGGGAIAAGDGGLGAQFLDRRRFSSPGVAASGGGEVGGIKSLVAENPVLILSRGGCCMCHSVKRLLQGLGVNPVVFELDEDREEAAVMEELTGAAPPAELHCCTAGPPQLPAVFIGGRFVGGLDRLMAAHISGNLVPILKEARALWL